MTACEFMSSDEPISRRARLRRTAILCCHVMTNVAYYRSVITSDRAIPRSNIEITISNNFLDAAVTDWCKLFGDKAVTPAKRQQRHGWRCVVSNPGAFEVAMLSSINLDVAAFEQIRLRAREYRDKFVSHLDDLETMKIPHLDGVLASASFLYDHLLNNEGERWMFHDAESTALALYRGRQAEGEAFYSALSASRSA
jgi:hypothetical protein